jgi:hypothetical protein
MSVKTKPVKSMSVAERRQFWREAQIRHRAREGVLAEIRAAASFIGLDLVQRAGQFAFVPIAQPQDDASSAVSAAELTPSNAKGHDAANVEAFQ